MEREEKERRVEGRGGEGKEGRGGHFSLGEKERVFRKMDQWTTCLLCKHKILTSDPRAHVKSGTV